MFNTLRSGWLAALLLPFFCAGVADAQTVGGIAPRFLIDPSKPDAALKQLAPASDKQGSFTVDKDGVNVTIAGGPAGYPGITLKPESGESWDLAPYGNITAKITNTGDKPLSVALRVDNAGDWKANPWNTESVSLKPGETKPLKVIFGYQYGYKEGYKLNSSAVVQLLFFLTSKSDAARTFRIDEVTASGSAGEKPPVDPNNVRVKPEGGVIFRTGGKLDPKQLNAKGGAKIAANASGALQIDFPGGAKDSSATVQPAVGSWDFRDFLQVTVKLKNTGASPTTPRVRIESRGGATPEVSAAKPIDAGAEGEITVRFDQYPAAEIPAVERQTIKGPGTWAEQNWAPQKGTGTLFTSNWAKGVTILSEHSDGAKSLEITEISASVPVAQIPEWLGTRPPVTDGEWSKTFEDNFDGDSINLNTWNIYTHNYWDKRTHFSKENTIVKDGKLILRYEKKTGFHNDNPEDKKTVGQTDYACGFADTYGKWTQKYGYFETRVKLPSAPGLWPAFWTMPDRGVDAGPQWKRSSTGDGGMELDILEFLSGWGPYRYNMAFHWDGYGKEHKSAGSPSNYVAPDKDGFITVGALWLPGECIYYAQGREMMRWKSPRVLSVPSFIMFNMVSGGWDNVPLEDAKLPSDFVIDYVRVWQRKDLASPEDGPKPNKGLPSSLDPVADYK